MLTPITAMIMRMNEVRATLKRAIAELFSIDAEPELTRPDEKFGDYATNAAMQLAPRVGKSPKDIAEALAAHIKNYGYYKKVDIAGPGFLNITLNDSDIWAMAQNSTKLPKPLTGQEILVEFGDPNPFKEMHIGHLYPSIVGDAIASLLTANGALVRRLSYHGDVGLHVAKAIWGMRKEAGDIGQCYAYGAKAYESDETARAEIQTINEHVYKHDDEGINSLYEAGRSQSLESFKKIYELLGIKYDKQYFESETSPVGLKFIQENRNVFKESDGALVYEGEKVGLHTRVFITSKGLPTYETKDLGLAELKNQDYPKASRSIILTANEQAEYFKVMLAALSEIDEKLAKKTTHLSNGFVSLSTGKMSSRSGDVYPAMSLLLDVKEAVHKQYPDSQVRKEVTFAAVKYAFLKHRLGSDMVLDINESISIEGNSGPYLQYAHARARGILAKTKPGEVKDLELGERSLARKIGEYPEVIEKATAELMPHFVTNYLYELAQNFNRFYEGNRVAGDSREGTRAQLVKAYAAVLKEGLALLNIEAPERV